MGCFHYVSTLVSLGLRPRLGYIAPSGLGKANYPSIWINPPFNT